MRENAQGNTVKKVSLRANNSVERGDYIVRKSRFDLKGAFCEPCTAKVRGDLSDELMGARILRSYKQT